MEPIFNYLPPNITTIVKEYLNNTTTSIEEIRLRIGRPIEISGNGKIFSSPSLFQKEDAEILINKLANHSYYTIEEELKKGYITIEGGHRVGLAGNVILENGAVKALRHISSFNIRIATEQIGVANQFIPFLFNEKWEHTMIIGAPQTGKTTILRDIARLISTGMPKRGIPSQKVGIVDERSEIAGCVNGIPQLLFGPSIDILDGCPKAEGMMMLIRSMSPDVLIVDEIGSEADCKSIIEAINAGITLVMTTHGHSLVDIKRRPTLKKIINEGVFDRFIELSRKNGPGTISNIRNEHGLILNSISEVT